MCSSDLFRRSQGPHQGGGCGLGSEMAKDKGEGEGTKPSSEAKGVAKIQDDTVRAREA